MRATTPLRVDAEMSTLSFMGLSVDSASLVLAALTLCSVTFPTTGLAERLGGQPQVTSTYESARPRAANFGLVKPSVDARRLADWVAFNDDNKSANFVVIDKRSALLYLFNGNAQLSAVSAVLLGSALGDDTVPGIGDRPIALVRPEERTTPAGRFVAERGRNARGEDVVWVDYDAAVSMHRVVTTNTAERRLERLASPTASDNRISYGCINLPVAFYESHIRPAFASQTGIVYILPEKATIEQVFGL